MGNVLANGQLQRIRFKLIVVDMRYPEGGAEAPPLAKLKLRKNIKYRIVLILFVSQ